MSMETWWNDIDGKTEELGGRGDLSQYHSVHHKSHMDCTVFWVIFTPLWLDSLLSELHMYSMFEFLFVVYIYEV
jgi:hypothetical protein